MKVPRPLRKAAVTLLSGGRNPGRRKPVQTGAIPWRCGARGLEILLVTSRDSPRWLIPKGWPMRGKTLAAAAAQEAFEEAGVEGDIEPRPFGSFAHVKQHRLLGTIDVKIVAHALAVRRELAEWPEEEERSRQWFSPAEAEEKVGTAGMRLLIRRFGAAYASRCGAKPEGHSRKA